MNVVRSTIDAANQFGADTPRAKEVRRASTEEQTQERGQRKPEEQADVSDQPGQEELLQRMERQITEAERAMKKQERDDLHAEEAKQSEQDLATAEAVLKQAIA